MKNTFAAWASRICLGIVLLSASWSFGQFTSNIQGTVSDQASALVAGAKVVLRNNATGISYQTATNESGQYRFLSLVPGSYTITVSQPGFEETQVQSSVQTEQTVGVNVTLKVASTGQRVTVTAEEPALNPEETRLEYTLEASDLANLPAQNHGTLNFIKLAPGTTGINENSSDIQPNRNLADSASNGLSNASNLYTLDGVPINSVLNFASSYEGNINGAVIFTPNVDSLGEVALQTTTFSVDYGNAASLQVGLSTKSGTNKFHGVADYTYNDKILNASAFLQPNKTANHKTIYSFALGGPIWKDHTFFFGSYEHLGQYGAGSGTAQWWSPEFQQFIATADAGSVNVQKFLLANPASRLIDDGKNPVTADKIFQVTNKTGPPTLLCGTPAAFNIPCGMRVTYEGVAAAPSIVDGKNWNIRGDQYLNNNKDRIFVYYFSVDQTSNSQSPNPTWDGETPTNGRDLTTNYTHIFNPNLLNSATFGYTYFHFVFNDTAHSANLLLVPFITQIFDAGNINGFTRFVPFGNEERQFYGRDQVLWTHGRHSFGFGVEAANNYATNINSVYARPFINQFYSSLDFFNDTLDSEIVLAHYNPSTGAFEPYVGNGEVTRLGLYAQDSWKINPRLTVNYGLRWDNLGNPAPYTGSIPWANAFYSGSNQADIAATIASRPVNHAFSSARDTNFLPRGGFAWTPQYFAHGHPLVLRGGIGLYQDVLNLENVSTDLTTNSPTGAVGNSFNSSQAVLSYGTDASKPPYGFAFPTLTPGGFNADGSPAGGPVGITGFDRNFSIPKSILWNLAVEQELPAGAVFSLTYSGSHSYNLFYQADLDRPAGSTYCTTESGAIVLPNPTTCASGDTKKFPFTTPVSHPVNPHWSSISVNRGGLESNYHALIAGIRQRWRTLNWQASYTWAHSLDDANGIGAGGAGSVIILQYDPKAQYSNSDFDVRNRFTASFAYEIPVPNGMNGLLREAFGGWNLNGDVIAQTGLPWTPYYNDNGHDFTGSGGNGNYYSIPDYHGTQRSGWSKRQVQAGIFQNIDKNAVFSAPACGICIGTAGRNQFWNPSYITYDQSIVKKFTLPWFQDQNSFLSLRGQAFNVVNRVNFLSYVNGSNNNLSGSSFGLSPGAYQGRVLQIGARFEF